MSKVQQNPGQRQQPIHNHAAPPQRAQHPHPPAAATAEAVRRRVDENAGRQDGEWDCRAGGADYAFVEPEHD
jgi:hypothetical protein